MKGDSDWLCTSCNAKAGWCCTCWWESKLLTLLLRKGNASIWSLLRSFLHEPTQTAQRWWCTAVRSTCMYVHVNNDVSSTGVDRLPLGLDWETNAEEWDHKVFWRHHQREKCGRRRGTTRIYKYNPEVVAKKMTVKTPGGLIPEGILDLRRVQSVIFTIFKLNFNDSLNTWISRIKSTSSTECWTLRSCDLQPSTFYDELCTSSFVEREKEPIGLIQSHPPLVELAPFGTSSKDWYVVWWHMHISSLFIIIQY